MVVALEDDPSSLFGVSPAGNAATAVVEPIFQSLLVSLDKNFKPVPQLATSWDVSTDGTTYTFHLNPQAKWTDGTPVTASDVVYTFQLLSGPIGGNPNGLMTRIDSTTALDDHTVAVKLKSPWPWFLTSLGNENDFWPIYPKHELESENLTGDNITTIPYNTAPTVTSGPFMVKQWVKGQFVELTRNSHYYLPGLPCLDRIVAQDFPDPSTREIAFLDGSVDFLSSYLIPFQDLNRITKDSRYSLIHGGLGVGTTDFLVFNVHDNRYLSNKSVRKAIAYAIDRPNYPKEVNFGWGAVAHSPINSTLNDFYTGQYDSYTFDANKANSMLDLAGFPKGPDGVRFMLRLRLAADRPFEVRGAGVIKSELAAVGIGVQILQTDSATFYSGVYTKHDFDLALQLHTTGPDPAENLPVMFGPAVASQGGQFDDPQLDALFDQDSKALMLADRKPIWDQIQKLSMDELPWLPLFEFPNLQLVSAKYKSVIVGALDYEGNFAHAYQSA